MVLHPVCPRLAGSGGLSQPVGTRPVSQETREQAEIGAPRTPSSASGLLFHHPSTCLLRPFYKLDLTDLSPGPCRETKKINKYLKQEARSGTGGGKTLLSAWQTRGPTPGTPLSRALPGRGAGWAGPGVKGARRAPECRGRPLGGSGGGRGGREGAERWHGGPPAPCSPPGVSCHMTGRLCQLSLLPEPLLPSARKALRPSLLLRLLPFPLKTPGAQHLPQKSKRLSPGQSQGQALFPAQHLPNGPSHCRSPLRNSASPQLAEHHPGKHTARQPWL